MAKKKAKVETDMTKRGIDKDFVRRGASKVSDDDIKKVVEKADDIGKKFEGAVPLLRFIEDFKLLISLVRDYWNGEYREIPWWAISAVVFALLYVLSPIDLIPDPIPVIGYLDDAAVVAVCLLLIEKELGDYIAWKESRKA
jgi:uncharacterized membrane protein YkvA (DUF1232 family)